MNHHLLPLLSLVAAAPDGVKDPGAPLALPPTLAPPSCRAIAPPGARVADRFIVVFRPGTDAGAAASRLAARFAFSPTRVYRHAVLGFAATLTAEALAGIRRDGCVRHVERDREVGITG
jgi:hypothetical protein